MRIRVVMLTENNKPIENLGENPEEKVFAAWSAYANLLTVYSGDGEKCTIEKIEILPDEEPKNQ